LENVTVPAGGAFDPESVSVTVATHVVRAPTATVTAEHVTEVEVDRLVTLTCAVPAEDW